MRGVGRCVWFWLGFVGGYRTVRLHGGMRSNFPILLEGLFDLGASRGAGESSGGFNFLNDGNMM